MSTGVPGVPGVPGRYGLDAAKLEEQKLADAARQHEMSEEAKHQEQDRPGFFRRIFRRSPR
jgi:hypothetical protein